jgi:outer membrane translocation and assembly module TamA
VRYAYEFLKTEDSPDPEINDDFTQVSALILDGQLERRDNPLAPRRGYRFFGNVEFSSPSLGSEAEYELIQAGFSGHLPLARGLILHGAVQHGVIFSPDPVVDLPFNKRFLPGGENTVRGYQRGGASPYNDMGQQLGAETFLLWNVELEQYLTERWSIVAFLDGVGIAADVAEYPFDEVLWSVGGGVRWNSIIGPVRAEYGYNLNRRTFDPEGTIHVSIGFPF